MIAKLESESYRIEREAHQERIVRLARNLEDSTLTICGSDLPAAVKFIAIELERYRTDKHDSIEQKALIACESDWKMCLHVLALELAEKRIDNKQKGSAV